MKVFYYTQYDVRWPRTNAIADMRFCEGLTQNNIEVTIVSCSIKRPVYLNDDNIFENYDIDEKFKINILNTFTSSDTNVNVANYIKLFRVLIFTLKELLRNIFYKQKIILISRDVNILRVLIGLKKISFKKYNTVLWNHDLVFNKKRYDFVYKNVDGIIATNSGIKNDLIKYFGILPDKITLSLNPISRKQVREKVSKNMARKELGIKDSETILLYSGKPCENEIKYIIEAAKEFKNILFLFTGFNTTQIRYWEKYIGQFCLRNIKFIPFDLEYKKVKYYQAFADLLLSYYSKFDHQIKYNLPNKIAEYMASGNPVLCADSPAIQDVLNYNNSILVESDNVKSLINGIDYFLKNRKECFQKGLNGLEYTINNTYDKIGSKLKKYLINL